MLLCCAGKPVPDNFTAAPHLLRHSPRDVILARPHIQRSCVSVATCTCISLLARLESYLVLIRIIRPLSISLTIYHYGILCHGGLQEWDKRGQPIHGIISSVSIRAEIRPTMCLVGEPLPCQLQLPALDGSHTIRSALITFILMTSSFHISGDKIWE